MRIKLVIIVSLVLILGCNNSGNKYYEDISKLLENSSNKNIIVDSIKYVLIIPNAGCDSCINEAETLLIDYKDKLTSLTFVLTTFDIEKSIYLKYGYDIKQNKNIIIDKNNHFISNGFNSIYPMILFVENGKLKKVELQSPENPDAVENLRKML